MNCPKCGAKGKASPFHKGTTAFACGSYQTPDSDGVVVDYKCLVRQLVVALQERDVAIEELEVYTENAYRDGWADAEDRHETYVERRSTITEYWNDRKVTADKVNKDK